VDHCGPRDLASVIGFVVYGLLLTLAWVCLSSVDVALTRRQSAVA
jgi:uncharacterized MnhB-related membrane protein